MVRGRSLRARPTLLLLGRAVVMDLRHPASVSGNFPVRAIVRWAAQTTGYVLYSVQVIDDITGRDSVAFVDWNG